METAAKDHLSRVLSSPTAFNILPGTSEFHELTTTSSDEVTNLIEATTARFTLLSELESRLPFVKEIQIEVLNDYIGFIRDAARDLVDASASSLGLLTSTVLRLDEDAVGKLCRWIVSVRDVRTKMEDWRDTVVSIGKVGGRLRETLTSLLSFAAVSGTSRAPCCARYISRFRGRFSVFGGNCSVCGRRKPFDEHLETGRFRNLCAGDEGV